MQTPAGELDALFAAVVETVRRCGRELAERAGTLPDIGGDLKQYLSVEDLRIETELAAVVAAHTPGAVVWAEELHADLPGAGLDELPDAWVIDPISSTEAFLRGMPHYAVVASHVSYGRPDRAVVYDPSIDELFTATSGGGAWCNGRPLSVSEPPSSPARTRVVALLTSAFVGTPAAARWWAALSPFDVVRPVGSYAVAYAWVAAGRYDGVLAHTKDAFPEFAGELLVSESQGRFAAVSGLPPRASDRWFYGGGPAVAQQLAELARQLHADDLPAPDDASRHHPTGAPTIAAPARAVPASKETSR